MTDSDRRPRTILLGFDGMDFDLTKSMIDRGLLPNLKKIADRGLFSPLLSVFPPDSIPSWITIFTGKDPSEHGILDHVNYLLGDHGDAKIDTTILRGNTFWDKIGTSTNTRVCIINPFMAYPVWSVRGVMVSGPAFIKGDVQISDPAAARDLQIPESIGGIEDLPDKGSMAPFLQKAIYDTRNEARFGLEILEENQPELFFQTFLTSDRVQHFLWRYCDRNDPTHPPENNLRDGIDDFFQSVDAVVGDFLATLNTNDRLLIISDHGHGMRCTHCFNCNEFLRRKGYLESASGGKRFSKKIVVEVLKNKVLKFLNDHDLEDYISKIARLVPNAKELKKGTHIADYTKSQAYAPDFAGTNPFGGIFINRDRVENYEAFRSRLIDDLLKIRYGDRQVFTWIKPRESIYSGKYIDRYPDILYEMIPKLGTGFSMHTDLFTVNPTHKKISGGHKKYGVFLALGPERWIVEPDECKVTNLHATLLSLFGLADDNPKATGFLKTEP